MFVFVTVIVVVDELRLTCNMHKMN